MKKLSIVLGIGAALVGTLGALQSAQAACPATAVIFLFDQSNSMNDPGSTGAPKHQIALAKAQADYAALPSTTEIGVLGFGNLPPTGSDPYLTVYTDLALGKTKSANNTELAGKLVEASAPGPMNTPLAGGACDALDIAFTAKPECLFETTRQVYMYSDGLENSTPTMHACHSTISSSTPFDASKEDQGFGLEDDSWQWHIANKAWTGSPTLEVAPPGGIHIVTNVTLLFDFVNTLSAGSAGSFDGLPVTGDLQTDVDANGIAFFKGIANVTNGSYFEAKKVNGVATKIPRPGDTDPTPTLSCVNQADVNRVVTAFNRTVAPNDPNFSEEDLAKRDVNNDLIINALDYQVVLANYGTCS
jgi:hypothetical protein